MRLGVFNEGRNAPTGATCCFINTSPEDQVFSQELKKITITPEYLFTSRRVNGIS